MTGMEFHIRDTLLDEIEFSYDKIKRLNNFKSKYI